MKDIIAFAILFPFLVMFLIQPLLHDAEKARGEAAKIAIERATERASIEGYYTADILEEVYTIMEGVGYTRDEVTLSVTETVTLRGDYVSAQIVVPNKYLFLIVKSFFNTDEVEMNHVRSATRMSEYVN